MLISPRRNDSNNNYFSQLLFVSSCLLGLSFISPANAQIIPDDSLGNESSIVTIQDTLINLIEGGAIRDNNLFHSFSEFNVNDVTRVDFANPDGIANILTRVTGNNISEIFGTLGVNGGANLFLLNPNGIIFGENAALDVNGSFLATTADSYIFDNGFAYSASNPETPPLLTVDIPLGVQFGSEAASVTNLSQVVDTSTDNIVGLQTPSEQSLALLGGNLIMDGGNLTAAGRVELGSVVPGSFVNLKQDRGIVFDYGDNQNFQDIRLSNLAKVEADDDIYVQGRQIILTEGSQITSNTTDDNPASKLIVRASEKLELLGVGENEFSSVFSGLAKNNLQSGTIDGEDSVDVETPQLILRDGSKIRGSTEGQGNSGDIEIRANSIEITGISESFSTTVIRSLSFGQGKAGNLKITAQSILLDEAGIISSLPLGDGDGGNVDIKVEELSITNGGQIQSGALAGSGNAGDLRIKAKTVNISGISPFRIDPSTNRPTFAEEGVEASSGLLASVDNRSTGNGGNIFLETDSLNISAGGKIGSNTSNIGNAGNIFIKAKNIEVRDAFVDFNEGLSGITTDVSQAAIGKGGDIDIEAESLRVLDGGQINASTLGQGKAGDITLNVENVAVKGISEDTDFVSRIAAFSDNDFAAGSIEINANTINIDEQAEISVSNFGQGDSGTLNINAQDLFINNSGQLTAEVNGGEQGNISLTTSNILLRNGDISAEATGTSTGGNITINSTDTLAVLEDSKIIANAIAGNGGNISINTQGYFVAPDSLVTASSEFGLDGNINIDNLNSDRFLELNPLPNNFIDATKEIIASCSPGDNKFAIAGQGGFPENPRQYLRGQTVWQDLRTLDRNLNPITNNSDIPKYSKKTTILEAQTWKINQRGNVELLTQIPVSERPDFGQSNHKCLR